MNTGERIRHFRKIRHLTQKELGEKVGLSEPAIRHYENGIRNPSEEQLEAISKALGISVDSLREYDIETAREALELLFRLEDEFGLYPTSSETYEIDVKNKKAPKLVAATKTWLDMRNKLEAGEITEAEYGLWKAELSL